MTLGDETETLDAPAGHDVNEQMVIDLRRMLKGPGSAPDRPSPPGSADASRQIGQGQDEAEDARVGDGIPGQSSELGIGHQGAKHADASAVGHHDDIALLSPVLEDGRGRPHSAGRRRGAIHRPGRGRARRPRDRRWMPVTAAVILAAGTPSAIPKHRSRSRRSVRTSQPSRCPVSAAIRRARYRSLEYTAPTGSAARRSATYLAWCRPLPGEPGPVDLTLDPSHGVPGRLAVADQPQHLLLVCSNGHGAIIAHEPEGAAERQLRGCLRCRVVAARLRPRRPRLPRHRCGVAA